MLDLQAKIAASTTVLSTEMNGELVMMDISTGNYFHLEEVSLAIWRLIAQPISVADLCQRLMSEYDAPEERIRSSVHSFLARLREFDLISVS